MRPTETRLQKRAERPSQCAQARPFRFEFVGRIGQNSPVAVAKMPASTSYLVISLNRLPISGDLRPITFVAGYFASAGVMRFVFQSTSKAMARGRIDQEKVDHSFDATPFVHAPEERELGMRHDRRDATTKSATAEGGATLEKRFHSRAERSGSGELDCMAANAIRRLPAGRSSREMLEESVPPDRRKAWRRLLSAGATAG